ncbi:uncharacterized protein LOC109717295 isoform X1 [Ananas comosus]|uniref:Uncharacterized protein LOC109717295 isoform X1 n=1 Tax=Ananas comosus TaxID=4615 RepID=A0A6P5FRK0_ANACO|nr:uncharacterized protein LOC109717295 isoform X1 [Ananas comosus]
MGIRHDLHPKVLSNNKIHIPEACYTMSSQEKVLFLMILKNLKVPDGYASNISRCVNLKERTLSNLKSHDCHILMQDILPLALRAFMPKEVLAVVFELSCFFKGLCSKALNPKDLDDLEYRAPLTLCHMEKIFPPSFFTIMVHLVIHLAAEAKLGGPVHYRWMYPIESSMMRLKSYVRNKAQPEGSIAEGYIAEECLTFCSRYFEGVETIFNRSRRNCDNVNSGEDFMFLSGGRAIGKVESVILGEIFLAQAHRYVLLHYEKISDYRSNFLATQRRANRSIRTNQSVEHKWLVEKFPGWLFGQVPKMAESKCLDDIIAIARGPNNVVKKFSGFIINGFRFHTKDREKLRKTQNSGVMVEVEGQAYYGVLTDIIELDYYGSFKVVLFRCDWADITSQKGLKKDTNGCTLVNFSKLIHTGRLLKDDPFVFSSQAKQVFYIQDPRYEEWSQVVMTKPRDLYDMGAHLQDDTETYTQCMSCDVIVTDELNDCISWARKDTNENNVL